MRPRTAVAKQPQRVPRPVAASSRQAIGKNDGIDGPGAAGGNPFEAQTFILEQAIQYAPGERPVGTAALQRQVDDLLSSRTGFHIHKTLCKQ